LKRHGGSLSKTRIVRTKRGSPRVLEGQEDVFPQLIEAGVRRIAVCHSPEEMLAALERWGIPLRGRIAKRRSVADGWSAWGSSMGVDAASCKTGYGRPVSYGFALRV
jgi:hypothetical protein